MVDHDHGNVLGSGWEGDHVSESCRYRGHICEVIVNDHDHVRE